MVFIVVFSFFILSAWLDWWSFLFLFFLSFWVFGECVLLFDLVDLVLVLSNVLVGRGGGVSS